MEPHQSRTKEAQAIRDSIVATMLADVEQRLREVRCPVDGRALTHISLKGSQPEFDGCCGALAEARRALAE